MNFSAYPRIPGYVYAHTVQKIALPGTVFIPEKKNVNRRDYPYSGPSSLSGSSGCKAVSTKEIIMKVKGMPIIVGSLGPILKNLEKRRGYLENRGRT